MSFKDYLLRFRVEFNLSQTDVANILGTRQSYISLYENGKTKPTKRNEIIFIDLIDEYKERMKKNV